LSHAKRVLVLSKRDPFPTSAVIPKWEKEETICYYLSPIIWYDKCFVYRMLSCPPWVSHDVFQDG
jgi:hypothetical protein